MASKPLLKGGSKRRLPALYSLLVVESEKKPHRSNWVYEGNMKKGHQYMKRLNSNANKVTPVTIAEILDLRDRLYGTIYNPCFDMIWRLTDERDELRKRLKR